MLKEACWRWEKDLVKREHIPEKWSQTRSSEKKETKMERKNGT